MRDTRDTLMDKIMLVVLGLGFGLMVGAFGGMISRGREPGYHHLMKFVDRWNLSTCESLKLNGDTCYRFNGHQECADTRDKAAEQIAVWMESHYKPVENDITWTEMTQ